MPGKYLQPETPPELKQTWVSAKSVGFFETIPDDNEMALAASFGGQFENKGLLSFFGLKESGWWFPNPGQADKFIAARAGKIAKNEIPSNPLDKIFTGVGEAVGSGLGAVPKALGINFTTILLLAGGLGALFLFLKFGKK
jgi:hypothetical protein